MLIILFLILSIIQILSIAILFYKIKLLDDDLEQLYDDCFLYINENFKRRKDNYVRYVKKPNYDNL